MSAYSRVLLSGSPSSGRPIPVAATATPGTLIHQAIDGAGAFDEIFLWASNVTGTAANLTVEWGGASTGDHLTDAFSIPPHSAPIPIAWGQVLNGGLTVNAFSGTASAVNISGYVNRLQ